MAERGIRQGPAPRLRGWCYRSVTQRWTGVRPSVFFATTFLLSWAVWLPLMLVRLGVLPEVIPVAALTPVALVGVLVPGVVATLLTARASGDPECEGCTRGCGCGG